MRPLASSALVLCSMLACSGPPRRARAPGAVAAENALAGDSSWPLDNPGDHHELEAYGARITLSPGDHLDVSVRVDRAQPITWTLYRVGWYGGAGARRIASGGPVDATPQPDCTRDPVTARVDCAWPPAFSIPIDAHALAGVYLVKVRSQAGFDWHVPLVVYDGRPAELALDVNVTSWQAYNAFGGESLYEDASGTMPHGKAWEVSFDRPFAEGHGAGRFLQWEFHFVRFVEALGYDVTYTTALDLGHDPDLPKLARAFVSVANDEYWTVEQRDAVEQARDAGVSLAFFGADQALWRIRLEPSRDGRPERVIACYKADQDRDPEHGVTARFRDTPSAQPENALIGVMYNTWMLVPQPLVVADATSWVFGGTGLAAGDTLPMMVSFETDARASNGEEPPGLQVLASSPLVDAEGSPQRAVMSFYQHPSGSQVVAAGSIGWPTGLGAPLFADPRVAQVTRNVLERFVGHAGAPDPDGAPWRTRQQVPKLVGAFASAVSTVAGAPGASAPLDGAGAAARFVGPAGVAVAPDGRVFVSDAPAHQIRVVAADGARTVSTYAGDGVDGTEDGPGASARFRYPTGLQLGRDGTLYVADSDNHVVRAIAPDAAHTVTTYAGMPLRGGAFADGPGAGAEFDRPVAIAIADDGALLVADMHNCRIRRVDAGDGHAVTTYAGTSLGYADGPGQAAQFNNPSGVAVAPGGVVYVLDTYNQALRQIAADGAHTVSTLAGGGGQVALVDGPGATARLGVQAGLAFGGGRLYVSDVASERVRVIVPGADAASTTVATFAGSGRDALDDGPGAIAAFAAPMGLAVAPDGSVWVADSGNQAIRRLKP
jgi:sugar lactone lactonase YvrE